MFLPCRLFLWLLFNRAHSLSTTVPPKGLLCRSTHRIGRSTFGRILEEGGRSTRRNPLLRAGAGDDVRRDDSIADDTYDWNAQWYPIIPLSYLGDKPVAVTVLGKDLVVWKDQLQREEGGMEESVSVFLDICPHRMAPLSTGSIVQTKASNEDANSNESSCKKTTSCSLKCRYHGWEFDKNGSCSHMPMLSDEQQTQKEVLTKKNGSSTDLFGPEVFHARALNGLVWAFLDSSVQDEDELPEIPQDSIPSETEIENSNWIFNRNPISFRSMAENTFDPAHAPFTHEGVSGFAGRAFSPDDALPMTKYELKRFDRGGFEVSHTPYQLSAAQRGGFETETSRTFVPPCTVTTKSPPFFSTKMWFVPSTPFDTNIISLIKKGPPTRTMKLAKLCRSKRLIQFLEDFACAKQWLGDHNYRFLNQDRIIMQGQDKMKWKNGSPFFDLNPTISDKGVATFQKWIQTYGRGGPFPHPSNKKLPSTTYANVPNEIAAFDKQLSVWESSGKFNPQMQGMLQSMIKLSLVSERLVKVFVGSGILCNLVSHMFKVSDTTKKIQLLASTILFASGAGALWLTDWSRQMLRRFFGNGNETWQQCCTIWK